MAEPRRESPDAIDAIVDALRSPARAEELAGEEELIETLHAAVLAEHHRAPATRSARSRTVKIGVMAGVAVVSVAGLAAAATGGFPQRGPERPAVTTVADLSPSSIASTVADAFATRSASTASTEATASTAEIEARPSAPTSAQLRGESSPTARTGTAELAPADAPRCPNDVVNHGDYVSGVAHDTPAGPGHGDIVSAAARSDCGKTAGQPGSSGGVAPAGRDAERGEDATGPGKGGLNGEDRQGQGGGNGGNAGANGGNAGANGGNPSANGGNPNPNAGNAGSNGGHAASNGGAGAAGGTANARSSPPSRSQGGGP